MKKRLARRCYISMLFMCESSGAFGEQAVEMAVEKFNNGWFLACLKTLFVGK